MKKLYFTVIAAFILAIACSASVCREACAAPSCLASAEKPPVLSPDKNFLLEPEINIQSFASEGQFLVDIVIANICQDTNVILYDNGRRICRISPQRVFSEGRINPEQSLSSVRYTIEYKNKADIGRHQIYIQFTSQKYRDLAAVIRVPEFDFILSGIFKSCGDDIITLEYLFHPLFGAEFGESETASLSIQSENEKFIFPDAWLKPDGGGLYYARVNINYYDYIENFTGSLKTAARINSYETEKSLFYISPILCFADFLNIIKSSPDIVSAPGKDKEIISFQIINSYHEKLELASFNLDIEASPGRKAIGNIKVRRPPDKAEYAPGDMNIEIPLGSSRFAVYADILNGAAGDRARFTLKDFIFRDPLTGQLLALEIQLKGILDLDN